MDESSRRRELAILASSSKPQVSFSADAKRIIPQTNKTRSDQITSKRLVIPLEPIQMSIFQRWHAPALALLWLILALTMLSPDIGAQAQQVPPSGGSAPLIFHKINHYFQPQQISSSTTNNNHGDDDNDHSSRIDSVSSPTPTAPTAKTPAGTAVAAGTANQDHCPNGLLTFELSTGFIYKPASPAETLAMVPSTLQLTDCLDSCLQNHSCLAINFEMGLCVLLSSSAQQNPTSLYSSQFPVFTIYAEKKCLLSSVASGKSEAPTFIEVILNDGTCSHKYRYRHRYKCRYKCRYTVRDSAGQALKSQQLLAGHCCCLHICID